MSRRMSRSIAASVLIALAGVVVHGAENITVNQGSSATVRLPFAAEQYDVNDKSVATVTRVNAQQYTVRGVQPGKTSVNFMGADGQNAVYDIKVQANMDDLLAAVRKMLDEVPEVEVLRAGDRVLIRGKLANLDRWKQVKTVAALEAGIVDLTTLEIPPEVIIDLKDALKMAGFNVADAGQKHGSDNPGVLDVSGAGNSVYVLGMVYSQPEVTRVHEIVAAQRQLAVKREPADKQADAVVGDRFMAYVNVGVVPLTIEVDLAFVALSDDVYKQVGVNLFDAGLLSIDLAGALAGDAVRAATRERGRVKTDGNRVNKPNVSTVDRTSGNSSSLTYSIASQMSGVLRYFTENPSSRLVHRAQLNFRNGEAKWRELHSGGTLVLPLTGETVATVEKIDYGFIMKTKGGLLDGKTASLDVDFELSAPLGTGAGADEIEIKRDRINTVVDCALGHTMVLGGINTLLDSADERATPFLSKIPLFKYLFSQKSKNKIDKRMLVLVSPHIITATPGATPHSAENAKTLKDSEMPIGDGLKE